jgi:hypothetical protein
MKFHSYETGSFARVISPTQVEFGGEIIDINDALKIFDAFIESPMSEKNLSTSKDKNRILAIVSGR